MRLIKKKYMCIFCCKRKIESELLCRSGHIGMCRGCIPALSTVAHPPTFPAASGVDYVISPLFYTGRLRDIIIDLKFNGSRANADVLADLMCNLLSDMTNIADFDLVVPVPLSKKRLYERGYNQSALIAKPFAEYFGVPFCEDALIKAKETKRQSSVGYAERHTNLKGAFTAAAAAADKRILLFDDIFTTGATLAECAAALRAAGARSVVGITLAATKRDDNIFNIMY